MKIEQPQHDKLAEMSTLGSILLDNNVINEISLIIKKNDFYFENNKLVYETITKLEEQKINFDIVTIRDQLIRKDRLEEIGGTDYLVLLIECVPTSANAKYYAQIVKEKSDMRNLVKIGTKIIKDCYETQETSKEISAKTERKIFELNLTEKSQDFMTLGEIYNGWFDDMEKRDFRNKIISGLLTGFQELDNYLTGLKNGNLIVIAGRPSMGKTSFALNIIDRLITRDPDMKIAFFSLEMDKRQIAQNLLSIHSKIDIQKTQSNIISSSENEKILFVMSALSRKKVVIDDSATLTISDLYAKTKLIKTKQDLDLLVIDYIQLLDADEKLQSRQQEIAYISRKLKNLARELNIPIIAISQLSRAVEIRENHRPKLSDLRESGAIEQDADVVLMLYRKSYYQKIKSGEKKEEKTVDNSVEIIIAKQRNGPTGIASLVFFKKYLRFEDMTIF